MATARQNKPPWPIETPAAARPLRGPLALRLQIAAVVVGLSGCATPEGQTWHSWRFAGEADVTAKASPDQSPASVKSEESDPAAADKPKTLPEAICRAAARLPTCTAEFFSGLGSPPPADRPASPMNGSAEIHDPFAPVSAAEPRAHGGAANVDGPRNRMNGEGGAVGGGRASGSSFLASFDPFTEDGSDVGLFQERRIAPAQAPTVGSPAPSGAMIEVPVASRGALIEPPLQTKELKASDMPPWLSAHAQATLVSEIHDQFHSPYQGPNSLQPVEPSAMSETTTVFLDAKMWNGADLIFNPEIAGGRGFSGVTGVAGFPNGEITRVGLPQPTPYVARLLLRQVWGFGGEQETVVDGANQVAGTRDVNRLTLFVGKMAFTDIIDNNRHSHDPRTQLMNWSMIYNGAWDYPADVRGYDYGFALDYNTKAWALRYGIFGEPSVANGPFIDSRVLRANGQALEFEQRLVLNNRPGAVRVMAYLNRAHMGDYREALAEMPVNPDITQTRAYRTKWGLGANLEQDLTQDLGMWARLGWNNGQTESWAFTEIDQTAAFGFLLTGDRWHRPQDEVGLGVAFNGISPAHREYLAAGGLGFILGDGKLNYNAEEIVEIYYNLKIANGIVVTGDFQEINNPGYNQDRGPVSVGGLRLHFEY